MRNRGVRFIILLIRRYNAHDTAGQGAALAYYLLFSIFPILILISCLIGQFALDFSVVLDTLAPILPESVMVLLGAYLGYVSENVGVPMLLFSAVFSVWFPMRATSCLMRAVRRAYGLRAPENRVRYWFRVLMYTGLLLFSLVLTLLVMTMGGRFMTALGKVFPRVSRWTALWGIFRFAALGAEAFLALGALYAASQDKKHPFRAGAPGAAGSTFLWIVISFGYSFYVENISNYSTIYGALGTVVVLLIWLYLTALTLIVGAEINGILLCRSAGWDDAFNQGERL